MRNIGGRSLVRSAVSLILFLLQAELPKIHTIRIRYAEGNIKDTHYAQTIEILLGLHKNGEYGIDIRPDSKIMN